MLIAKFVLQFMYDFHVIHKDQEEQPRSNTLSTTPISIQASKQLPSTSHSQSMDSGNPQKEFSFLISEYYSTIRCVNGCGDRGQYYVENAYRKLQTFIQTHPEFTSQLPKKFRVQDDGTGGFSTGIAFAASSW